MALSAAQYTQLKLNLRAFQSANRYTVANLSEADLLSFWNQLATDSASATDLPAAQYADIDRTFRAMLCANNSLAGLPNADWDSFFTQLATDAAGAASLPAAQTAALRLQLRALISGYKTSPFNLSEPDLLGYFKPRIGFSGAFAPLFPGAYQILQSDRGLTYGSTTLATGTTPPVGTLAGTLSATSPIPLWFKCTNAAAIGSGATFSAYADGLGVTPFMTGITPSAGVPVALTGAAAGLTHAWAAGTAALDNVWKATCASLTDQGAGAKNGTQPTASLQPVVTVGLNGCAGIAADGVDDLFLTDSLNLPAPGTTPYYVFAVFRYLSVVADATLLGNGDFAVANIVAAASGVNMYNKNPTQVSVGGIVAANWNILEIKRANNALDTTKIGAVSVTGSTGNNATVNARIFGSPGAGPGANAELLALVYTPNLPDWVAVRAAVTAKYGVSVTI